MKTAEVNWDQLKALFPVVGRVFERQVLRIETLRKLKERNQEEDETEQLRKLEAREILSSLVKLEEWK
ncbi:hypothetical protein ES702_05332 [subsurface metagenome]